MWKIINNINTQEASLYILQHGEDQSELTIVAMKIMPGETEARVNIQKLLGSLMDEIIPNPKVSNPFKKAIFENWQSDDYQNGNFHGEMGIIHHYLNNSDSLLIVKD